MPDRYYPPPNDDPTSEEFWDRRAEVQQLLDEHADRIPIKLPHVGETFVEATYTDAANKLYELRELGYQIPQYAIEGLLEDAKTEQEQ